MLKNTFCQVAGIGIKTEKLIWNQGILDWESFKAPDPQGLSRRKISDIKSCLQESHKQFADHNPGFFARLLPSNLHWRLFPEFRHSTAHLDIETTGMAPGYDSITTIALYDGRSVFWYVNGKNLDNFKADIHKYTVIVSYMAVLLWHDYQRNNNPRALDTLLAYNIQDAVTLENLMVTAYNLKIKGTPFDHNQRLPPPPEPPAMFQPDPGTIARLKQRQCHPEHLQLISLHYRRCNNRVSL